MILVFSFGHVQDAIDPLGVGVAEGRMLIAWGLLLLAGGLLRSPGPRGSAGRPASSTSLRPSSVSSTSYRSSASSSARPRTGLRPRHRCSRSIRRGPRIYYLIFDRYAADRTLRDDFAFDNQSFSRWLEDRGFYVAKDSLANYPKTTALSRLIAQHDVPRRLARHGGPGLGRLGSAHRRARRVPRRDEPPEARLPLLPHGLVVAADRVDSLADENLVFDPPTGFDDILLESTIIPPLERRLGLREWPSFQLRQYRRVPYQFDALERDSLDPEPTFTFAHLTLPHPPYVFNADGSFVPPEVTAERSRDQAYLAQLEYANRRIEELVDGLVAAPGLDPIIVLQSDEGPHPIRLDEDEGAFIWPEATDAELGEKLRNLNAYYLPGLDDTGLYPTISPVNTFRLIFDGYFDADLPLLPDRTFVFESNAHPYRLTDVTERLRPLP